MNTVSDILLTGFIFFLGVFGLYLVVSGVGSINTNLDNESIKIVSEYDSFYANVNSTSNKLYNSSQYDQQVSNNGVDAFFRAVSEAKTSADYFKIAKNIFWGFPKALVASVPLVPYEVSGVIIGALYGLISIFSFIAIFKFWFGGNTG